MTGTKNSFIISLRGEVKLIEFLKLGIPMVLEDLEVIANEVISYSKKVYNYWNFSDLSTLSSLLVNIPRLILKEHNALMEKFNKEKIKKFLLQMHKAHCLDGFQDICL